MYTFSGRWCGTAALEMLNTISNNNDLSVKIFSSLSGSS